MQIYIFSDAYFCFVSRIYKIFRKFASKNYLYFLTYEKIIVSISSRMHVSVSLALSEA